MASAWNFLCMTQLKKKAREWSEWGGKRKKPLFPPELERAFRKVSINCAPVLWYMVASDELKHSSQISLKNSSAYWPWFQFGTKSWTYTRLVNKVVFMSVGMIKCIGFRCTRLARRENRSCWGPIFLSGWTGLACCWLHPQAWLLYAGLFFWGVFAAQAEALIFYFHRQHVFGSMRLKIQWVERCGLRMLGLWPV